ncbi:Ornithine decarboxylase [Vanrija pseudolonga]|uniref:ornithine decarboxylase n=1 Tax=Vanrija pseudolonga TaxID=143232 RepID=A0AAF1BEV3_9TREE|nr:Ornithine decarboxylase [Vanrija pseudolonga]
MSSTLTETTRRRVGVVRTQPWDDSAAAAVPRAGASSAAELGRALEPAPESAPRLRLNPPVRAARPAHDVLATPVSDAAVHALVDEIVAQRMEAAEAGHDESAFFAADLGAVYDAVQTWRRSPIGDRVELFYAVKCNPSPMVLHLLSLLGTSFDCASVAEFNAVLALPSAPAADRVIFANPCKPASFIRAAANAGVDMMTFDNADELHKIKRAHPGAKLVLRILTDDSKSLCRLGLKFGAPLDTCASLLALAKSLDLNVIGVSFHVGSGCKDKAQFADAVWRAKKVFGMAEKVGYDFKFLDIGGGFERETFADMSEVVRESLDLYFPEDEGVRVIAEPGRFLVSSAFTLATSIIARRKALDAAPAATPAPAGAEDSPEVMYYINDGVYGSFNCIMFDHQIVHPYPLTIGNAPAPAAARPAFPPPPNVQLPTDLTLQLGYADNERASVWGPTCDSIDCVRSLVHLPRGVEVGDWIGWGEMGAYTLCAASTFNGFDRSPVHWTTGGDSPNGREVRRVLDAFHSTQ